MQKTKNFLISTLVGTAVLVFAPNVQADNVNDLVNIVEKSTQESYLQAESDATLSLGENVLTMESTLTKNANRIKQEATADLVIKAETLPAEIFEEFDGLDPDFELNISGEATSYYDKDNGDIFYEISDYEMDLTSADENTQKIIEGFFEITKIFTGETYYINLKKLAEEFESFAEEMNQSGSMMFQEMQEEDFALLLKLFLESGFFNVENKGNVYTITLKNNVDEINRQAMIDTLQEMDFLPLEVKEEVINELENAITESDYMMLNTTLAMIENYYTFELKITTNNSDLVEKTEIDFSLNLSEIIAQSGLEIEIPDFKFNQTTDFSYGKRTFAFPKEGATEISLNKILGMFLTFGVVGEEYYNNHEETSSWEDVDWEEEEKATRAENLEKVVAQFGDDVWFMPYVKDLIEKDLLTSFVNPERTVSQNEFRELLNNAVYSGDNFYAYSIDYNLWDDLSSYESISKLDAVTYIVQTFFPEETNPTAFAREKGIVSSSFSVARARQKDLILAELVKMLSVTLELLEE